MKLSGVEGASEERLKPPERGRDVVWRAERQIWLSFLEHHGIVEDERREMLQVSHLNPGKSAVDFSRRF